VSGGSGSVYFDEDVELEFEILKDDIKNKQKLIMKYTLSK
jgi:hypothetical protein